MFALSGGIWHRVPNLNDQARGVGFLFLRLL